MTRTSDHELARDLAAEAGARLVKLRADGAYSGPPDSGPPDSGPPDSGPQSPRALGEAGDRMSHEFLIAQLAAERPDDVVLSEEALDDPQRLSADRVWIVDPLDGTREFGEVPRTDWAVHVALWERGAGLTAGAVALPAQHRVLTTADPPALKQVRAGPADRPGASVPRVVVSRTRAPQFVMNMGVEVVQMGSAGAKVGAVISGAVDAYIHAGGFYEWDTAAPVAVARAAGFHASRIDGTELLFNQADLLSTDILVCRTALAGVLLQAIREVTHA